MFFRFKIAQVRNLLRSVLYLSVLCRADTWIWPYKNKTATLTTTNGVPEI